MFLFNSMLETVPFRCSWGVRPRAGTAAGACAVDRRTVDRRLQGEVGSSVKQGGSSTGLKIETYGSKNRNMLISGRFRIS